MNRALMKRTFRDCAMISGLIEKNIPGREKTGRQVTFSADLIFDVLRSHEPDHILCKRRALMRQPACSISGGSVLCWRALMAS